MCPFSESAQEPRNALHAGKVLLIDWVPISLVVDLQHASRDVAELVAVVYQTSYAVVINLLDALKIVDVGRELGLPLVLPCCLLLGLLLALDVQDGAHDTILSLVASGHQLPLLRDLHLLLLHHDPAKAVVASILVQVRLGLMGLGQVRPVAAGKLMELDIWHPRLVLVLRMLTQSVLLKQLLQVA